MQLRPRGGLPKRFGSLAEYPATLWLEKNQGPAPQPPSTSRPRRTAQSRRSRGRSLPARSRFAASITQAPQARCRLNPARAKIALRQAWTLSDPAKVQRLLENLAKKYDDICPGAARSLREGMPEMLTLTRLGLPYDLRKSLASTNIMESVNSVIARASRNVTRWRNASMGLRRTAAGMLMA